MPRWLLSALGVLGILAAPCGAGEATREAEALARLLASPPEDAGPVLGLLEKGPRWVSWSGHSEFGLLGAPWDGIADAEEEPPPTEQAEDVRGWIREAAAGADLRPLVAAALRRIVVDVAVETAGEPRWTGRIVARPSHRAFHAHVRRARLLRDYDPELACDNSLDGSRPSALGDPVVGDVLEGIVADVRPFLVDGGRRVALEALVQWGRLEGPLERIPTGARFLGEVDLPRIRGGVALLSGTVRSGEPLVARVTAGGRSTVLTLLPRVEGPDAPRVEGRALRCLEGGLAWLDPWQATRAGPDMWHLEGTVHPFVAGRPTLADPEDAREAAALRSGGVDLHVDRRGRVWCAGDDRDLLRLEEGLADEVSRRARTVRLEVRAFAGDAEVARLETHALTGRGALLRIGLDRAFLADADAEVG